MADTSNNGLPGLLSPRSACIQKVLIPFRKAKRGIKILNKESGSFLIEMQEFPIRKIKLSIRKLGVSYKEKILFNKEREGFL